jgi:hypothetical protein
MSRRLGSLANLRDSHDITAIPGYATTFPGVNLVSIGNLRKSVGLTELLLKKFDPVAYNRLRQSKKRKAGILREDLNARSQPESW